MAESPVFRAGGISYLRIPGRDLQAAGRFYAAVFGWKVDLDRDEPSFEDGTGHVIGHFVAGQAPAAEDGVRPYVFVESVDDSLARVVENGGAVLDSPYPEGNLRVATFRDPAGNVVGLWQLAG